MYIGKIFYALLFCAALPILLVWWATELTVGLPVDRSWKTGGAILVVSGVLLITEAMWRLWKNGKGLPMNAFPPTQYVQQGAYRLFHHPIYFGFCISCAGASILFMSPAGLHVLTPVMVILCCSLVFGYETLSLKKRFGLQQHSTFFGLMPDTGERAYLLDKIGVFCSVFIPWFISYQWIIYIGVSPYSINTVLSFEKNWGR
jgi:protein-S-isoprenylcysteine O-methyltransferase Ste14